MDKYSVVCGTNLQCAHLTHTYYQLVAIRAIHTDGFRIYDYTKPVFVIMVHGLFAHNFRQFILYVVTPGVVSHAAEYLIWVVLAKPHSICYND